MFKKKNLTNADPRMGVCNLPDECTENESENKANWTLYTVIGRVSRPKYTQFLINGQRRVGTYVPGQSVEISWIIQSRVLGGWGKKKFFFPF